MPSSTPDWSALTSQNERLVDGQADQADQAGEGPPGSVDTHQRPAAPPGRHRGAAEPVRRPKWRGRTARGTAAGTAAILAVTGVASVSAAAATPSAQSWHVVKRSPSGGIPDFSAVTAVGKTGGWAFNQGAKPTAWKRSGSTWTKVSFPGKKNEIVIAAKASSAANVWAFTDGFGKSRALRWNSRHWAVERSFSGQIGGAVVLSRDDVWVFGEPITPGSHLGTWHFNGRAWRHVRSGPGLEGGSGLSAASVWAFGGTSVAHWNGHTWSRTSVKALLPAKSKMGLNDPAVTAIYAASARSVWAVGNGNAEDDGGPLVVLHYNGHDWSRVARSTRFAGFGVLGQVAPDGRGGLWIPMPGPQGGPSHLVHYSGGHLTAAALPVAASKINVQAIAAIPHTTGALAGGFTHAAGNLGKNAMSVILQFRS